MTIRKKRAAISRKEAQKRWNSIRLLTFTVIYFVFVITVNGLVEVYFPGVRYLFGRIPVVLSEGFIWLSFALYSVIAIKLSIPTLEEEGQKKGGA